MRNGLTILLTACLAGLFVQATACSSGDDTSSATTTAPTTTSNSGGSGGTSQGGSGGTSHGGTGGTVSQGGSGGGTTYNPDAIGGDCTCTDNGNNKCTQQNVPKPAGGTIVGCDDVPTSWTGAAPVCLRTYTGDTATHTYFAGGFCALQATKCVGNGLICGSAVWGNYDQMTTCPVGTVMLSETTHVTVVIGVTLEADVSTKTCAPSCTAVDAGQCREGAVDDIAAANPSQYQCMDKGGVKFCYDARDLGASYTAQQF